MSVRKFRNHWQHFWRSISLWARATESNFLEVVLFGGFSSLTVMLVLFCLLKPPTIHDLQVTAVLMGLTAGAALCFGIRILYRWSKWDHWHKGY